MHFPKSKIHKELGHCPDAGYPKMAKVELSLAQEKCGNPKSRNYFEVPEAAFVFLEGARLLEEAFLCGL